MKLSEVVSEAIALADATFKFWDAELPKRCPTWPFVPPGQDDVDLGPWPPEQLRLKALLESLPRADLFKLWLLGRLGLSLVSFKDLAARYAAMERGEAEWESDPRDIIREMSENWELSAELIQGLEELQKRGIGPDEMLPVKAVA